MLTEGDRKLTKWKKISSKEIVNCGVFTLTSCQFMSNRGDGAEEGSFFVVQGRDSVQVVAETVDGKILLVEQFRFGSENLSLELPGGLLDSGESVLKAAERELAEETGFSGELPELIAQIYPNPAIQATVVGVVLIRNCLRTGSTNFDKFEDLSTIAVHKRELVELIRSGKISNCITMAAVMRYFMSYSGFI